MSCEKPVRACLCYPNHFADIQAMAQAEGWSTVRQITENLGCGSGCGLCAPYLAKMLRTGETEFEIMSPDDSKNEASAD